VAGENLEVWTLVTNDGYLNVPAGNIADVVLHGENTRLRTDVEHSLQIVCGLGIVRVLEEDQRKLPDFVHNQIAVLRLKAESQL
jgi:hypothetical protein